ncbi:MAG: hypothetical protein DHS20C11_06300 [Lysobacteraceae bacterium]|nr:MAG: hypothetical protein DHS20C11_06300 [Xanthomonadaceae bacterium]
MKEETHMEGSWRTIATSQLPVPALKGCSFNPSLQVTSKLAPELQRYEYKDYESHDRNHRSRR